MVQTVTDIFTQLSNGQIPIGITGGIAAAGTLATDSSIVATPGAGTLTIKDARVVNAQTLAYTAIATDNGKVIRYTGAGGVNLDLTAAGTLGNGWFTVLRNDSAGNITVDPAGAETINGIASLTVEPGQSIIIFTNGALFYTVGQASQIDGANQALSNLAAVAINTSLIVGLDNNVDLGDGNNRFKDIYAVTLNTGTTDTDALAIRAYDVDGAAFTTFITLTAGNTPTCALAGAVTGVTQAALDNSTKLATTAYVDAATGGGSGAPSNATFITQTPNGTLSNEQALSALATGILKSTTATGVVSIAAQGTDYYAPGGTDVALADGGTNASLTASNGGIFYSTAAAGAILSGTATALQMLQSGANSAPAWSSATWPATTTVNQILYSSAGNVVGGLATANSSMLVTDGSGIPSLSTTIPNGVVATTQTINDASTKVATTAYVNNTVKLGQTNVACNSNTTFTQNVSTNQYFKLTFTSNCTLAFTFDSGLVESMCLQLIDAGSYTITWTGVLWAGGAAPTFTASGTDSVVIWHNGDNILYGALIGKAFA